jgi:hypothetical protein
MVNPKKRPNAMRIAVFAAVALLSGCITVSPVVPMETDQYSITVDSRGPGMATVHEKAQQQAQVYCAQRSLFVIRFEDRMSINAYATNLIFRCEKPPN